MLNRIKEITIAFQKWIKQKKDSYIKLTTKEKYYVEAQLMHANMSRIAVMLVFFVLTFIYNIVINVIWRGYRLAIGDILCMAVVIAYFIILILIGSRKIKNKKVIRNIFRSFWFLMNCYLLLYVHYEITHFETVYNYLLGIFLLGMIPLLSLLEILFMLLLVVGSTAYMILRASPTMQEMFIQMIVVSTILAILISQMQYISFLKIHLVQRQLIAVSERDGITGLFNRRGFDKRVELLWPICSAHPEKTSMLLINIDNFKSYNDTYGHIKGDKCLKAIGDCIQKKLNKKKDIAMRYSGEEFVVLMVNTTLKDTLATAVEIKKAVGDLALRSGDEAEHEFVTISIGIAGLGSSYFPDIDCFIEEADRQMYMSKKNGRNHIVFQSQFLY